ncbi:MAG TPA: hypothetical protein VNH84_00535 [Candidatus Saccharimonadales bacterium]|nr:hypothetical protein [Candidatus Saccharimonadales bacterium]
MKRTIHTRVSNAFSIGLCLAALAVARADDSKELTAFELIKQSNRYVGEDAKDKIVQVRSEKSLGSMTPTIWYVVHYDPDATAKATEVKFGAGQKLTVKRPARVFELASKAHLPMDKDKLKIDSDKALETAMKDPQLKNLKLLASRLTLELWEDAPTWKVRLWAAKLRNPNKDADIGEILISAESGKPLRNDLHIEHVD